MARKKPPTPTLKDALELARQAPPEHNEAIAIQIGRVIAADASNLTRGVLFLSGRGMSNAAITKALGAASKRPATPRTVCAEITKLIDAPAILERPGKVPTKPFAADMFGKAIPRRNTSELEDAVQARLVAVLMNSCAPNVLWFAIPNGGYRSPRTAARLKATGTRAGVPDMAFVIGGRTHFLELKRARGGSLSDVQIAIRDEAIAAGAIYAVAKGFDAAIAVLRSWGAIQ
jgi:hypothetical protein